MTRMTLLELQEFGIKVVAEDGYFIVENEDSVAPRTYREPFETLRESAFRVAELILDENRVYAMEDQSDGIQRAYANLQSFAVRGTAFTFLREVVYDTCYSTLTNIAAE